MTPQRQQYLIYAVLILFSAALTAAIINNNEPKETGFERAMEELGDGIDNAADELDHDRTAGEKFGDAIEDMGDDIKDVTNN